MQIDRRLTRQRKTLLKKGRQSKKSYGVKKKFKKMTLEEANNFWGITSVKKIVPTVIIKSNNQTETESLESKPLEEGYESVLKATHQ